MLCWLLLPELLRHLHDPLPKRPIPRELLSPSRPMRSSYAIDEYDRTIFHKGESFSRLPSSEFGLRKYDLIHLFRLRRCDKTQP